MEIETIKFVRVSFLVPETWNWFYEIISDNAPFSWGDNNYTMVSAQDFADHCENCFDFDGISVTSEEIANFLEMIRKIPSDVYIDLEN